MTDIVIRGDLNISDMTEKEKADLASKLGEELKAAIQSTTNGYMKAGYILDLYFEYKLYKYCASHIRTWPEWVSEFCPFKVAMADHMRRVSRTFRNSIGDRVIPFNRLLEALPVTTDNNINDILEDAEALPRRGWEDSMRVAKGRTPSDECPHSETETWERCSAKGECGKWLRKL